MLRYLRLFGRFVRSELQYEMAYRLNLAIEILEVVVVIGTSVGAVLVIYGYADALNGWTLPRMLALLGVYYIVQGASELVVNPSMEKLIEHVRLGTLDFTLLKPASSQFLVSVRHVRVAQLSQLLLGFVVLGLAVARLEEGVSAWDAFAFTVALACGLLLIYALVLVLSTTAFWFVRVENVLTIFWAFMDAGRFPIDFYPGWLRLTLSSLVPIGVAVTLPAQAISGRLDPLGLALMVAGAAAATAFAAWFWRLGLRSYTGASA